MTDAFSTISFHRCLQDQDGGSYLTNDSTCMSPECVCVWLPESLCAPAYVCCLSVDMTNAWPVHSALHSNTHCHLFALSLLLLPPYTCIITPTPSVSPAIAPMSKPNTTDQQLGMQIVSLDKLCTACQLHTWALGWLSVTCVRVPLHLRRCNANDVTPG